MAKRIATNILIISDTHGESIAERVIPREKLDLDLVIHCGDLTQHSKLDEFRTTINSLMLIKASLKVIIAGNHDFSLDLPVLCKKIQEGKRASLGEIDEDLLEREYGKPGEAQQFLQSAKDHGILFLEEGNHKLILENGTSLNIFASPYTPSTGGEWGFQYDGEHDFNIDANCDIVISHGPPKGIMDMTKDDGRIGCPQLFKAIARAQPKLHCFGHVHNAWGAKLVSWIPTISEEPSHFKDIDNSQSQVLATLSRWKNRTKTRNFDYINILPRPADYPVVKTSHKSDQPLPLENGKTLFVNAANMGDTGLDQPFWLVELELSATPAAASAKINRRNISKKRTRGEDETGNLPLQQKRRNAL